MTYPKPDIYEREFALLVADLWPVIDEQKAEGDTDTEASIAIDMMEHFNMEVYVREENAIHFEDVACDHLTEHGFPPKGCEWIASYVDGW